MKWYEVRTAFFRPLWRRIAVVALVLVWTGVELRQEAWVWAAVFGAAGVYLIWAFFVAFEDGPAGRDDGP